MGNKPSFFQSKLENQKSQVEHEGRALLPAGTTVEEGWKKKMAEPNHTYLDDIVHPRFCGNSAGCSILCGHLSPLDVPHDWDLKRGEKEIFDQDLEAEFGPRGEGFVIDASVCPCLGNLKGTVRWTERGAYPLADWTVDFRPGWKVSFPSQQFLDHHPRLVQRQRQNSPSSS